MQWAPLEQPGNFDSSDPKTIRFLQFNLRLATLSLSVLCESGTSVPIPRLTTLVCDGKDLRAAPRVFRVNQRVGK